MGYRRVPTVDTDLALDTPPPNWLAHRVWHRRWGVEYRPPLPRNRAQAWRIVFAAGPVEPHLEHARRYWSEFTEDRRRRWWESDDVRPGEECTPCPHHHQAVALCPKECPTVARLQRRYDAANQHYWTPGAQ